MAFFNDLVRVIAEVEGIDPMTVRGVGLNVRDGGHISKGGRGLSAAKMTSRDAANLIIGVNACVNASKASEIVGVYRGLRVSAAYPSKNKLKGIIKDNLLSRRGLGAALEGLIELCAPTLGGIDLLGKFIAEGATYNKATSERIAAAHSLDDVIRLEIKFERPNPRAFIEIQDISTSELIFRSIYSTDADLKSFDRCDITAISLKTIRAVGSIIYS